MENFLQKLRTVELKKMIYPGLTSLTLIIVIILVIASGTFLSDSFNGAFRLDEKAVQSRLIQLDIEGFKTISEKLGI